MRNVKEWGYLSKSNVGEITPPEVMQGDIIPVFIKIMFTQLN
jgi:hypothetical protein